MLRKLAVVVLPTVVMFLALCIFAGWHQVPAAALVTVVWITGLVLGAIFSRDPDEATIAALLPMPATATADPGEPWKSLYDKATQMHIDTDKGMYQLIAVFVPASLLVLSWVVASTRPDSITRDKVIVVGSLAVVLVGIATLLKHRLRHYNKLREVYLRKLEKRFCGNDGKTGLHTFFAAACDESEKRQWSVHFNEAIDIYYVIYLFVWIVVYYSTPA